MKLPYIVDQPECGTQTAVYTAPIDTKEGFYGHKFTQETI